MTLPLKGGVTSFVGLNGAGKTTVLDAVHILGTGKPFSSHRVRSLISQNKAALQVVGRVRENGAESVIGVSRQAAGSGQFRLSGAPVTALSQLARELPLVLLNSDTLNVLRDGPEARRALIDKFVFHVEHSFLDVWRRYQQALRQRNAVLRERKSGDDAAWIQELGTTGSLVHSARLRVTELLASLLEGVLDDLGVSFPAWRVSLRSGWDEGRTLSEALLASRASDRQRGFTQVGPHRGDLLFLIDNVPADQVLSRGQMKVLAAALRLAQGRAMRDAGARSPVLLVDDVAAELDGRNAEALFRVMAKDEFQVLATMVNASDVSTWLPESLSNVFHVEHGAITNAN